LPTVLGRLNFATGHQKKEVRDHDRVWDVEVGERGGGVTTMPRSKLGERIGQVSDTDMVALSRGLVVFLGFA
jgi:hypothetical protein